MVKVIGVIDYDSIKDALQQSLTSGEGRIQIVDASGNVISNLSFSALKDALQPTRTTPSKVLTAQSIPAADKAEFTVSDGDGYSSVVVTVKAAYNASATAGVRIRWLYSPDSINFDSIEDAEAQGQYYDLSFTAGQTKQATILIPVFAPVIAVQIVNQDSNYPVTVNVWSWYMR